MNVENTFDRLIGDTYETVSRPELWPVVLRQYAGYFGARDAALYQAEPGEATLTSAISGRMPSLVTDEYLHDFAQRDKQIVRLLNSPAERALSGFDLLDHSDEKHCPVHHDYLIPHGISKQVVWFLPGASGHKRTLAIMREERFGAFSARAVRAFGTLARHVQRSLDLAHNIRRATMIGRERELASPDRIAQALGLSPRESQVALGLARGRTLEEIAASRRVSIHTVRNQLKSIYTKTELNRQKDVVAAVFDLT